MSSSPDPRSRPTSPDNSPQPPDVLPALTQRRAGETSGERRLRLLRAVLGDLRAGPG